MTCPEKPVKQNWLKHKNRTLCVGELIQALSDLDPNLPVGSRAWIMGAEVVEQPCSRRSMDEGFIKDQCWVELKRSPYERLFEGL